MILHWETKEISTQDDAAHLAGTWHCNISLFYNLYLFTFFIFALERFYTYTCSPTWSRTITNWPTIPWEICFWIWVMLADTRTCQYWPGLHCAPCPLSIFSKRRRTFFSPLKHPPTPKVTPSDHPNTPYYYKGNILNL